MAQYKAYAYEANKKYVRKVKYIKKATKKCGFFLGRIVNQFFPASASSYPALEPGL